MWAVLRKVEAKMDLIITKYKMEHRKQSRNSNEQNIAVVCVVGNVVQELDERIIKIKTCEEKAQKNSFI